MELYFFMEIYMRYLCNNYAVHGQIYPDELRSLQQQGFTVIINHRPDDEMPEQPTSSDLAKTAKILGLYYYHIPIMPNQSPKEDDIQALKKIREHHGDILYCAFCGSGKRASTMYDAVT